MSAAPPVSVIMPVYNGGRYLADAAESVLSQTFADFEFLILNDGSTDGSRAVLEGLAARDPRVRLTSRPNRGLVATLNELIGASRGEFLARMDADDVCEPERFAVQVEHLRSRPDCLALGTAAALIGPDADPICVRNADRLTHEQIDEAHLREACGAALTHPSVMMRRGAVEAVGGYREGTWPAEDMDLWLRLAEVGRLANLERPLIRYRLHPSSIGYTRMAEQRAIAKRVVLDACARRGLPPWTNPLYDTSSRPPTTSETCRKWGWWALGAGRVATARKYAWKALTHAPAAPESWRLACCAIRGH